MISNTQENQIILATVIIPCVEKAETWLPLLTDIESQTIMPKEVIFAFNGPYSHENSSKLKEARNNNSTPVNYIGIDLGENFLFPGDARNQGIEAATYDLIGFLDVKTKPDKSWLEESLEILHTRSLRIVFGKTKYIAKTKLESLFIDCTYGRDPLLTIPGSLTYRKIFREVGYFLPNTRTGEDTDWIERARNFNHSLTMPCRPTCTYTSTPGSLYKLIKKWFYSYYKCCTIVPHLAVQRLYYLVFFSSIILLAAYRWNASIAAWDTESIFYIMYATRTVLALLVLTYISARGIVMPLRKKVPLGSLLPLRFLAIALISGILDVVKMTAYTSGVLRKIWR